MATTLQDLVYYGAYWQILDRPESTEPIRFGGGYTAGRIERTDDGDFFAGIVEKRDARGRVTDVILAFAGAQGADAAQGEALSLGVALEEPLRAAALYDALLADPRYARATIHVTGHSLGAGYAEYVLAHSLATYGPATTDARAEFVAFGAPDWGQAAARATGIDIALMEARFTDYTAANDPVLINGQSWNGFDRIGTTYYLPAFDGLPGPLGVALSPVAAHWPTTYAAALGLPDWLGGAAAAATAAVSAQFQTGDSIDPAYGAPGTLDMLVNGSTADDVLIGRDGDDVLVGHGGRDILRGGAGADMFRFDTGDSGTTIGTADIIRDFAHGEHDRIDLSRIDARPDLIGKQDLTFVEGRTFTAAGQVTTWIAATHTFFAVNLDADGDAELLVMLDGRVALTADDFLLTGEALPDLPFAPDLPLLLPYVGGTVPLV